MDALMVDKGDPWNPEPATIERSHRMCAEVSRVLVPGGVFVQLSFEQIHFRKKFLLGEHVASAHAVHVDDDNDDGSSDRSSPEQQGGGEQDGGGGGGGGGGGMYGWDMQVHDVQQEGGCFGQLLYVLRKRRGTSGDCDCVVEKGQ